MGGGKAKSKNKPEEPVVVIKSGKSEFSVGTKIEAKDSTGNWYGAKILKIRPAEKELLVHFDGWNTRYNTWLPHNSPRIRILQKAPIKVKKVKEKPKEWRIGERIIAKWGPAGRIYPATISKIISEAAVEVTFYDGFKKTLVKSSLKPDTEKLYRKHESTLRKNIVSPPKTPEEKDAPIDLGSSSSPVIRSKEKRRLTEPAAMADYVTDLHKKRRNKLGYDRSTSEDDKPSKTMQADDSSSKMEVEKVEEKKEPIIPKVKLKLGDHTIAICTNEDGETITHTYPSPSKSSSASTSSEKLIERCGIDIDKKKNKSYVMFPTPDKTEEEPPKRAPTKTKSAGKKGSNIKSKGKLSDPKLKVRFPFGGLGKTKSSSPAIFATESDVLTVEKTKETTHTESISEQKEKHDPRPSPKLLKDTSKSREHESNTVFSESANSENEGCPLLESTKVQTNQQEIATTAKRRLSERVEIKKKDNIEKNKVENAQVIDVVEGTRRRKLSSKSELEEIEEKAKVKEGQQQQLSKSTRSERRRKSSSEHAAQKYMIASNKDDKNAPQMKIDKPPKTEVKNFEQKYEMFKQKWKAEKERRRLLKDNPEALQSKIQTVDDVMLPKITKPLGSVLKEKESKESAIETESNNLHLDITETILLAKAPSPVRQKPRIKHTPSTRFGKGKCSLHRKPLAIKKPWKEKVSSVNTVAKKGVDKLSHKEKIPDVHSSEPVKMEEKKVVVENKELNVPNATEVSDLTKSNTETVAQQLTETDTVAIKKKGWPKGKPRKRKIDSEYLPEGTTYVDTSRTPNMMDTLSFASMVEEERPSQRSRPVPIQQVQISPKKHKKESSSKTRHQESVTYDNIYKSYTSSTLQANKAYPSLTQIVASRIQRRVHQQKMTGQPFNSIDQSLRNFKPHDIPQQSQTYISANNKEVVKIPQSSSDNEIVCNVLSREEFKQSDTSSLNNELDLTGFSLSGSKNDNSNSSSIPELISSVTPGSSIKKRKSLDFITGRLQYKKKIEAMKQQNEASSLQRQQHQLEQRQQQQQLLQQQQQRLQLQKQQQLQQQRQHVSPPPPMHSPPGMVSPMIVNTQYPPVSYQQVMLQQPLSPQLPPHMLMQRPMIAMNNMPVSTYPSVSQNMMPVSSSHHSMHHYAPLNHSQGVRPPFTACSMVPPVHLQKCMMTQDCPCPSCHQKRSLFVVVSNQNNPRLGHPVSIQNLKPLPQSHRYQPILQQHNSNMFTSVPVSTSTQANFKAIQKIVGRTVGHSTDVVPIQPKPLSEPLSKSTGAHKDEKDQKSITESRKKRRSLESIDRQDSRDKKRKGYKDFDLRRPKSESEKELKTTKSEYIMDEFKCALPGCGKSFRKSHLLEYHLKYYHTAKPTVRRSRSSISISSTDSNPPSTLTSPVPIELPKVVAVKIEDSVCFSNNVSNEVDILEMSDNSEESESEEELPTVDDCVKCLCEDECELGFMIQCEQCFTWQHGECVGYSTQKAVPLFYLCHVCSKPKGLRPSCRYNNDYTWYRHGRLSPNEDPFSDVKVNELKTKEMIESIRHVDKEDEEVLASIMLTTHAMVNDLYNIRGVLQNVRNKFVTLNKSSKQTLPESTTVEEIDDSKLEALLHEIDKNSKKRKEEIIKSTNEPSIPFTTQTDGITNDDDKINVHSNEPNDKLTTAHLTNEVTSIGETSEELSKSRKSEERKKEKVKEENSTEKEIDERSSDGINESTEEQLYVKSSVLKDGADQPKYLKELRINQSQDSIQKPKESIGTVDEIKEQTKETSNESNKDFQQLKINERETKRQRDDQDVYFQPIKCHGIEEVPVDNIGSCEDLSREQVIVRYELLVEIERIEDEVEKRMKEINSNLDELEMEYNDIDKSKKVLKQFKEKFQLPDMKSLTKFLNKIKWTSYFRTKGGGSTMQS